MAFEEVKLFDLTAVRQTGIVDAEVGLVVVRVGCNLAPVLGDDRNVCDGSLIGAVAGLSSLEDGRRRSRDVRKNEG